MSQGTSPHSQLIQECMQSLRKIVKALEEYSRSVERRFDLTGPQLWALWELGRKGPLSLKDLAARMHLESSTVVGVVDRLVAAPHPAQGHLLVGLESMDRQRVENLHEALRTLETVLEAEKLDAPFFFSEK